MSEINDGFNEQTNHMQFETHRVEMSPIQFTPGVPTEDGWYVVKYEVPHYMGFATAYLRSGKWFMEEFGRRGIESVIMPPGLIILSHAKLPEL